MAYTTTIRGTQEDGTIKAAPVSREGHLAVQVEAPRLPFGSIHAESLRPIFQLDSVYGLNPDQLINTTGHAVTPGSANSGSVTGTNNLFKCSTGTTQYSFASLQSRERLRYHPGTGIRGRFTALFSAPAASSILVAGLGTSESGYYFGYNGTSFGILHSTGGVREIQTLTVTTASTATNDYEVQLSGVTTNVTATNNGSTTKTAYEIAQGTFPGWAACAVGATVVFLANSVGDKTGSFTLGQSGAGTPAAGSYAETLAGVAGTDTWIAQGSWNGDPLDGTGPSGVTLDQTKGNVFQIDIQHLGFGPIVFYVETSNAGNKPQWTVVHTLLSQNSRTSPTVSQPSFPFTMSAYSAGSTTDVSVSCASFAGFIEGQFIPTGPRMTPFVETNGYVASTASTYYPLFTIRNNLTFSHSGVTNRANQSVVYPISISAAHDDATPITFYVIKNATLVGTPSFSQFSADSCVYWDTAATTCSFSNNAQVLFAYTLAQNASGTFAFADPNMSLQPNETLTIAARAVTGTATYVNAALNTREDQ